MIQALKSLIETSETIIIFAIVTAGVIVFIVKGISCQENEDTEKFKALSVCLEKNTPADCAIAIKLNNSKP